MTAAAGDWFVVPRRGRVEEAVGAVLGAGLGAARDRRRGIIAYSKLRDVQGKCGTRRIATASDSGRSAQGCTSRWHDAYGGVYGAGIGS
jgi:hypothetical protein